jgi:hypothetical protein
VRRSVIRRELAEFRTSRIGRDRYAQTTASSLLLLIPVATIKQRDGQWVRPTFEKVRQGVAKQGFLGRR